MTWEGEYFDMAEQFETARTAAAAWKAAAKKWKGNAERSCFECFAVGFFDTTPSARAEYLDLLRARGLLVEYLCSCGNGGDGDHARHGLYCKYRRKMEEEVSA